MKRKKPMKRVSDKRAKEQREYLHLRAQFLHDNPYCQVWLKEHGVSLEDVIANDGWASVYVNDPMVKVPRSEDVHHVKKRGKHFLDVSSWLAVSRRAHRAIHDSPSWAREAGYLQ